MKIIEQATGLQHRHPLFNYSRTTYCTRRWRKCKAECNMSPKGKNAQQSEACRQRVQRSSTSGASLCERACRANLAGCANESCAF